MNESLKITDAKLINGKALVVTFSDNTGTKITIDELIALKPMRYLLYRDESHPEGTI